MGKCSPVPHIFQRRSTQRASSAPEPGTATLFYNGPGQPPVRASTLTTGPELELIQGTHYAHPGMVPLPVNPEEAAWAAEALGKELTRALKKTGVPLTRPLLEDLTINFGIGLADDPAIARMMLETISRDRWDD